MKRVLGLRNNMVVSAVLMALLFTTSSFTFSPAVDASLVDDPPQKKEQRVKVIVRKDGKETKIDTTFNLPDEKMISAKVDSMLKKLEVEGLEAGNFDVLIHHPDKRMNYINHGGANFPGDEKFDILIQHGDSGMRKHVRKIIHIGENGDVFSLGGPQENELLPPPPPPVPPISWYSQFGVDPFAFDSKDESIISYDKKNIGKGLERITIIRKKKAGQKEIKEVQVRLETSDDPKK